MTTRSSAANGTITEASTAPDAGPAASPTSPVKATSPATAGRRADAERRHQRVLATITTAIEAGDVAALSVAALARATGVHRSYVYRHPELIDLLQEASRTPASAQLESERVSAASLRADLAHARDRAARAETEVRKLRQHLSEALGQQVWTETGLGPVDEAEQLRAEVAQLRQEKLDLTEALEERDDELEAARTANRELMATINTRN